MPERPKRPGPPVPDPNWEVDLHGGPARKSGPESKDELLAHALLRAEPEPPVELPDDFGDLERSTVPPPEAMSVHVARMMAQAALLEDLDDEGDRPTPLLETDTFPTPRRGLGGRSAEPVFKTVPLRLETDRKDTPLVPIDSRGLLERKATPLVPIEELRGPLQEDREDMAAPLHLSRVSPSQSIADLSDLPAVFSLDGLSLDEPASDAAISPTLAAPPVSEPAISPPFGSLELPELVDELAVAKGPSAETMSAIESRFEAGDYARALVLAESALIEHPGDPAVTHLAEGCREMLYQRYLERLGAANHIPRLAVHGSAITGLTLDHRAGFLLSCVDGGSTIEEIIDVSAMPRLDAVRILYELVQEGVIEMASPR